MWCARLSLSRPDSAVVVRAGRNWAAFGSPFFYLRYAAIFCGEDALSSQAGSKSLPFCFAADARSTAY